MGWSKQEDEKIISIVKESIDNGETLSKAFKKAGGELLRNPSYVSQYWYSDLRKRSNLGESVNKINGWSEEEDFKVTQTVLENTKIGMSLQESYSQLEKELENRSVAAIAYRWSSVLKPVFKDEYEEAVHKHSKESASNNSTIKTRKQTRRSWTQDEDDYIKKVVLKYSKEGKSLDRAYKRISSKLNKRTKIAVEARYRLHVKPTLTASQLETIYGKEIIEVPSVPVIEPEVVVGNYQSVSSVSETDVQQVKAFIGKISNLLVDKEDTQNENNRLKAENEELRSKYNKLQREYSEVFEDYKAMLKLLDRARQITKEEEIEKEAPIESTQVKFKMDRNGNLTKI